MKPALTQIRSCGKRRFAAAALVCWALVSACGGPTTGPEEQLRQWVSQGTEAAEAKERRALVNMISPAYADARGNERDDIERLLRFYFFRMNNVKLLPSIEEIRVFGDSAAEIDLTVAMAGTREGAFGFNADAVRFELELQRDDNDWVLISARWGELGEELN